MKNWITTLFTLFLISTVIGQDNSHVYLFDITEEGGAVELSNPINISNTSGYNNQPSFLSDGSGVLFASTRDGQTDVALYKIEFELKTWLTDTKGSEYSPAQSNADGFSAVRLDKNGKQLLYQYNFESNKKRALIKDLKIGYYTWYNNDMLVSFVLGQPQTLQVSNLKTESHKIIDKNIGRSIHKIPNTDQISYISNEGPIQKIYALNPQNGEKTFLANALKDSQDMAWTPDGAIIMGKDNMLFRNNPTKGTGWEVLYNFSRFDLNGISRLAISPKGDKIAIVFNSN